MSESKSLNFFDDRARAERYQRRGTFAPERTAGLHAVMLKLLTTLTSPQAAILELGAGTGHLTAKLLETNHFRELYVTDGAAAMLDIARQTLEPGPAALHFHLLDFTTDWPGQFPGLSFDAITSSMALHHAADKQLLFRQIFSLLKPQGVFVLGDHMAGASSWTENLLIRERALIRLGRESQASPEQVQEVMNEIVERGRKEGNLCESVAQYEIYMKESGFAEAECIWRDYWLAVFVARKPAG